MGGNKHSGSEERNSQKQRDFDDLQNEIAGRDAGRDIRFRNKEDANGLAAQRRRVQTQAQMTALDMILQSNPEYARMYNDTSDLLDRAETATSNVLDQVMQDLAGHEDDLNDILDQASQLPDGTRVFKDQYGYVWSENDELVAPKDAESVVWKDDAPSREGFMQQKQKVEDTRKRIEDIQHYQIEVLGNARDRMNDQHNLITQDEMKQIQDDIFEQAGPIIQNEIRSDNTVSLQESQPVIDVAKPPV